MSKFNVFMDEEIIETTVDPIHHVKSDYADSPQTTFITGPARINEPPVHFGDFNSPGTFYDFHVGPGSVTVDPQSLRYTMGVQGNSIFNGEMVVNGPLHANGPFNVNGDLHINGFLEILGQRITREQLIRLIELIS